MNFHKISQKFILLAALIWSIIAFFRLIELRYIYVYFGILVLYIGIQNIIILNLGVKKGEIPAKITHYQEKFGEKNGIIFYALFSIVLFLVFGAIIIYSALKIPV